MRALYPNLAFEDELAGRRNKLAPAARRAADDLSLLMALVGEPGDRVYAPILPDAAALPDPIKHVQFARAESWAQIGAQNFVPWGWSTDARTIANQLQIPSELIPTAEAVATVNARTFNSLHDTIDSESSPSLPFGHDAFGVVATSMTELKAAVRQIQQHGYSHWVAKPQHSHAGRNRLVCRSEAINKQQEHWLIKHFSEAVYVEPWVDIVQEAGLQFEVVSHGGTTDIRFHGVAGLMTDSRGQYTGSIIRQQGRDVDSVWAAAIAHGQQVCHAASAIGYRGPIGIDVFQFRTPTGSIATRLCSDINGRFTMGRLALSLNRYLDESETGLWMLAGGQQFSTFLTRMRKTLGQPKFRDVRAVVCSPENLCNRPVYCGSVLLIGSSPVVLSQAAKHLTKPAGHQSGQHQQKEF